jgi:transcriptional regulator with XRE-family HTH domain
MNDIKKEIGGRIKAIRKTKRMSLEALGEIIGVGKSSVHGYESGENYPNPEAMIKIARMGDKTLDWLITGKTIDHQPYPVSSNGHGTVKESTPFNLSLIKEIIEAVEKHIQSNHLEISPAKISELVVVLYEEAHETGFKKFNEGTIARMIKLAS